jgi:hypothetical protein
MKGWGLTWAVVDHPTCVWDPTVFVKSRLQTKVGRRWCRESRSRAEIGRWTRELRLAFYWTCLGPTMVGFCQRPTLCGGFSFAAHFGGFPNWAFHGPRLSPKVNCGSLNPPKTPSSNGCHVMTQLWMNLSTELISGFTSVTHSVRSRF